MHEPPLTRDQLAAARANLDQLQAHIADAERRWGFLNMFQDAHDELERLEQTYALTRRQLEQDES